MKRILLILVCFFTATISFSQNKKDYSFTNTINPLDTATAEFEAYSVDSLAKVSTKLIKDGKLTLRYTYVNFSFEVDTAKLARYKETDYNHSGGVLYISGSTNYFIYVEEYKNEKPNGKWRLEYLDFTPDRRGFFFLSSNVFMSGYSFRRHLHNPKYVMVLNIPSTDGTIHKIIFDGSLYPKKD
jgi:hypothetical protein